MPQTEQPAATLMRVIRGFQVSQAIHVATVLGIADLLNNGPRSSDDLARATSTDPAALYRLLRFGLPIPPSYERFNSTV